MQKLYRDDYLVLLLFFLSHYFTPRSLLVIVEHFFCSESFIPFTFDGSLPCQWFLDFLYPAPDDGFS